MKTKVFLLIISLGFTLSFTQAQSKKDLEQDYATCQTARDSLQKELDGLSAVHESLTKTYDSVSKVCTIYDSMYIVIKEKVFHYDFNPVNMPALLDSLSTERELAFSGLSNSLNDSIALLTKENTELKAALESLTGAGADKTDIVNNLKQLKELLDANIITQEEYDAKKAKLIEKL
jgi:hypothetical protein